MTKNIQNQPKKAPTEKGLSYPAGYSAAFLLPLRRPLPELSPAGRRFRSA